MHVMKATDFQKALMSVLCDVIENDDPLMVSTAKGNVVILNEKSYNGVFETISILSQEEQYKKIKEGEKEETSQMKRYDSREKWQEFERSL